MSFESVESICVFGSVARSSEDNLSDKDVLIVAEELALREFLSSKWRKEGWNVSMYTPRRFEKMAQSGSLFVQHLKHEGSIIEDRFGWLQHQLARSCVKKSYRKDGDNSIKLALPIERFRSNDLINDQLLVSDVAFVSIRNLGICRAADKGKYIFDYSDIIDSLQESMQLGDEETTLIKSLRAGKSAYRNFQNCDCTVGTIGDLTKILEKLFKCRSFSELDRYVPIRDLGSGYSTLRDFEAALLQRSAISPEQRNSSKDIQKVIKAIRSPQKYSWEIRNLDAQKLNGYLNSFSIA